VLGRDPSKPELVAKVNGMFDAAREDDCLSIFTKLEPVF
jgi:hypothetical protein